MLGMTADQIYGAGPGPARSLEVVAGSKAAGGGQPVPSPSPSGAPASTAQIANLTDDPTFWLVVLVGAAIALGAYSAS